MTVTQSGFGRLPGGQQAILYTLSNGSGLTASITPYGARMTSIKTPGRGGDFGEILLGYDAITPYLTDPYYLGATIGRYANRIGGAAFEVDGKKYNLTRNEGANHLHGGSGFHTKLWDADVDEGALIFRHISPHGEDGYPGDLSVILRIYWDNDKDLRLDYSAQTDAPCPINLTNHNYFNLGKNADIRDHSAQIFADHYLPTDPAHVPKGEIASVAQTSLDLRRPAIIGHRFNACALPDGFDHSYVTAGNGLRTAATVSAKDTGRMVTLLTTQPGLQFYTGVGLKGGTGRNGEIWPAFAGLCLEGQHHPDSPNICAFPDTVLRPGETYTQTQIYRFETA